MVSFLQRIFPCNTSIGSPSIRNDVAVVPVFAGCASGSRMFLTYLPPGFKQRKFLLTSHF